MIAPTQGGLAELHGVFQEWLRTDDTEAIDTVLATYVSVMQDDPPIWLLSVAPPSNMKTELLTSLMDQDNTRIISKVTPQTFMSGHAKEGASLLERIPDRCVLIFKDFTTVLNLRSEARAEILAQLREIYDGNASASFGTGKDTKWQGKIGVLAAATPDAADTMTLDRALGERFLIIRLRSASRRESALRALQNGSKESGKKTALRAAVKRFLASPRRGAQHITMSGAILQRVAALADFVSIARTVPHRNYQNREIDRLAEPEGPTRIAHQFGLLARCLAAVRGHDEVTEADMQSVIRVGYDCLEPLRKMVLFKVCAAGDRGISTQVVLSNLSKPRTTLTRILEDFQAVNEGLIRKDGDLWFATAPARDLLLTITPNLPDNPISDIQKKEVVVSGTTEMPAIAMVGEATV